VRLTIVKSLKVVGQKCDLLLEFLVFFFLDLSHCDTFYVDLLDLVVFGVQFIEFFKRILRNHSFIHVDCSECLFFSEPLSLLLGTVGTLCLLIISTNINIYIMD
jgi:hypothetical protein